ncbi:hypothetical protein HDU67_003100 [Dinochytrium kinnereticum]|nr:hypothetical protein HDU67_003100 [Dinochytrium kinnereticum]
MSAADETMDYNAVEKVGADTFTKVGLQMCQDLLRETDNRNPEFFQLKVENPDFGRYGELEVVENQLRVILKHFKNANKKKSPQSAWKPVYASLEALTLYLRSKDAWFDIKEKDRVEECFKTFGAAWVATSERLAALGALNENSFPSIRTVIAIAMSLGNQMNLKYGKKISQWPEKLESVWTGNEFEGDRKKRTEDDEGKKKGKKGGAKKGEADEDEDKKKSKKSLKAEKEANVSPWDFEAAFTGLKAGRKQVGGTDFDIAMWPAEQKARYGLAA